MFAVSAIVVQNEELLFLIETSIRENQSTFNVSCDILTKLIQSSNIVQVGTTKNRFRKLKVLIVKLCDCLYVKVDSFCKIIYAEP